MTILVTGGAGFIGTNFVRLWCECRPEEDIVVLDALTYAGRRENIDALERVRLIVGDICNTGLVIELLRDNAITQLVHFAAESHVDRSIDEPAAFIKTNVVGTQSLLDAAKSAWIDTSADTPHRFLHISTDEVYGSLELEDSPFTEATPFAPNSPYAASKAASDHLVRAWHKTFGLDTVITNCSNNYGPFQVTEKLIPMAIESALRGKAIPIYGDGRYVRDWLYVDDHCRAIMAALDKGKAGETYAIGGGTELFNIRLVERICDLIDDIFASADNSSARFPDCPAATGTSCRTLITSAPDRQGHDRRYAIDDAKARAALGYSPQVDIDSGLERTVRWYMERLAI